MNLLTTTFILGLTLCFGSTNLRAQNVNIPDANFKAYLVNVAGINTNGDGEIQVTEATAFSGRINCPSLNIADMTGIETFVNLTELFCHINQLSSLNVTQNTKLTTLGCHTNQLSSLDVTQNTDLNVLSYSGNQITSIDLTQNTDLINLFSNRNQLTSLDLSQNINLTKLYCNTNQLSTLDVSQNTSLTIIDCHINQLTSLDFSQNDSLRTLECDSNQLTSLNIKNGTNTIITLFKTIMNPNLTCIQADDSTYSTNNWTQVDPIAIFSTNCGLLNSINSINQEINLSAYPNPTTKEITLDLGKTYQEVHIQVSNLTGQMLLNKTLENTSSTSLELEGAAGVYFVRIKTKEGAATLKVIKE